MSVINFFNIEELKNAAIYGLLKSVVSEKRRIKADKYYNIEDSKRCICAELLLKYSLFKATGHYGEIVIGYNQFGKPFLTNIDGFLYNITHSGKWVVFAYASTEIGVDIEQIQKDKTGITEKFFTKNEGDYINSFMGEDRKKKFTQIWTLKESYIKYLGTGLSTRLDSFSISVPDGKVRDCQGNTIKGIKINSCVFDTDYYLSVCGTDDEMTINEVKFDDLSVLMKTK